MTERTPCQLAAATSCGCRWLYLPQWDGSVRYMHGDNPEAVFVMGPARQRATPLCSEGHLLDVEEWAQRVHEYEHGAAARMEKVMGGGA